MFASSFAMHASSRFGWGNGMQLVAAYEEPNKNIKSCARRQKRLTKKQQIKEEISPACTAVLHIEYK